MAPTLTWLGHGTWQIDTNGIRILLDPFLDDQPTSPVQAADVNADFILISHGHFDHVADAAAIAKRCGSTIIAIYEIAEWFSAKQQIEKTIGMNIGGGIELPFGHLKMTEAVHSSQLPDGSSGGIAGGFVLTLDQKRVYFACDTALFSDMQLIGQMGLEVAVLPIGDLFTMGPDDSIAATKLLQPRRVIPAHYNTWEPIAQDVQAWARQIQNDTDAIAEIPTPGVSFEL